MSLNFLLLGGKGQNLKSDSIFNVVVIKQKRSQILQSQSVKQNSYMNNLGVILAGSLDCS